jgi:hypothetical protein
VLGVLLGALLALSVFDFDLEPLFAVGVSIGCIGGGICLVRGLTRVHPGTVTVLGALPAVGGLRFGLLPLFAAGVLIGCIGFAFCFLGGMRDGAHSKFGNIWVAGGGLMEFPILFLDRDGLWFGVIMWIGFAFFVIGTVGVIYDAMIHSPSSDDPPPPPYV